MSVMPDEQLPQTGYVYRPTVSEGVVDWIGPDFPATPTDTILCLLSQLTERDERIAIGEFDATRVLLFCKPTADIQAEDRVVIDGVNWKVVGTVFTWKDPNDWTNHHKECILISEDRNWGIQ